MAADARGMITARIAGAAALAARLTDTARRLAEARVEARRSGARRWRHARLLWPLLAKER
jgi:hypothetical protein